MGLPILAAVLSDDRDDLDLVRGALEVLLLAMAGADSAQPAAGGGSSAAEASCPVCTFGIGR